MKTSLASKKNNNPVLIYYKMTITYLDILKYINRVKSEVNMKITAAKSEHKKNLIDKLGKPQNSN